MSANLSFTGVWPILVTPFDASERLDLPSLTRLIRFMAGIGVDGVTVLGVLGESNRLLDDERREIIRTAVAAADGLPVVVGASHAGTRATVGLANMAADLGASAVMVAPSQEPVPDENRVFEYYRQVVADAGLPVVVQDHPASTQVHLSVALLARIVLELPGVACIKEEATPTPTRLGAIRRSLGERRIPILTGLGALYGLFDLAADSDGFNTGFAFPEVLQALVAAHRASDSQRVHQIYRHFLPLIVFEQQPGVAIRKEILRRRGLIADATVRHPGAGLAASAAEQLSAVLALSFPDVDVTQPWSADDLPMP